MLTDDRFLTTEEIADILGVMPRTVRDWLRSGQLIGTLINRSTGYRVRASELERFLDSRTAVKTAQEALRSQGKTESDNLKRAA